MRSRSATSLCCRLVRLSVVVVWLCDGTDSVLKTLLEPYSFLHWRIQYGLTAAQRISWTPLSSVLLEVRAVGTVLPLVPLASPAVQ